MRHPLPRWLILGQCLLGLLFLSEVGCRRGSPQDAPSAGTEGASTEFVLQLNWRADAQHGGFFAAQIMGAYQQEGLAVTIHEGGPGTPVIPKLVLGRIDVAVANADQILQAREEEADILAIFAPLQHSPRCIIVHADSDIREWEDLRGVTLAMNEGRTFAMFIKQQLPLEDVRIVSYGGSVAKFLVDPNFAQQGYSFSEPHVIRREGGRPRCLMVADLGFDPYTSSLAITRATWESRPDTVRRFVRAVRRGWRAYLTDPEVARQTHASIQQRNPDMDADVLEAARSELRRLAELESSPRLGQMTAARWEALAAQMQALGIVKGDAVAAARDAWVDVEPAAAPGDEPALGHDGPRGNRGNRVTFRNSQALPAVTLGVNKRVLSARSV